MEIDKTKKTPIYIQIYENIIKQIDNDFLLPNDIIPSSRQLSKELNVARITVNNAYEKLVADGYIVSHPGKGYYVASKRNNKMYNNYTHIFSSNGLETSKLPFETWSKLIKQSIKEDNSLFQHGEKYGELCLKKSIQRLLSKTQKIQCKIEQIVIGPGANDLLREIFLLLYDKPILLNNYYNYRVRSVISLLNTNPHYLESGKEGVNINELYKHKSGVLYQKPLHDLPTGVTLSEKQRLEIINWASDEKYIIEDSNENNYCYGNHIKTMWELSGGKNIIFIGSFSSTIAPSMKIGYLILPENILDLLKKKHIFYSNRVSRIEQVTLSKFINLGYYEQHVEYMKNVYHEKMLALISAIKNSPLDNYCKLSGTEAGTFCIANFDIKANENEARNALLKNGIKVFPVSTSIANLSVANYIPNTYIIGFGDLKISQIQSGIKKWAEIWKEYY